MADETTATVPAAPQQHSLINSKFPVLLPDMPELHLSKSDFDAYINELLPTKTSVPIRLNEEEKPIHDAKVFRSKSESDVNTTAPENAKANEQPFIKAPFMEGLLADKVAVPSFDSKDGKMLTENADVAYRDSGAVLVDLFYELEDVMSATRLKQLLEAAWKVDAEATLKIIWNARSIHLGKSSRMAFYRAVGWLAENHPKTLAENLVWLVRPLIQKKAPKKDAEKGAEIKKEDDAEMIDAKDADSDFEMVEGEEKEESRKKELEGQPQLKKLKLDNDEARLAEFDVKYGVSHGYWKDLLNILALAANDQLKVNGDPRSVLNREKPKEKLYKRDWTQDRKKSIGAVRYERVVQKLDGTENVYKALHLTVARLFAEQLKLDLGRLQSGKKSEMKHITLAAKWAPGNKTMHDEHTCIATSIAELLHPFDSGCVPEGVDPEDRELCIKHARIAYQSQTLSPLRKHLQIVERNLSAKTFDEIKYDRLPSLAMKQYTPIFAKKDFAHFDSYIENVAAGKARISGATLLPSTLVSAVKPGFAGHMTPVAKSRAADTMVANKLRDLQLKSIDGQWNTLVQRIKDSGTMESSIAVCDVSGSMSFPQFPDGTCPLDSSIGLSLLLAEITKPPFGGAFITFSASPQVMQCGGPHDKRSFEEKVKYIEASNWSTNTDFVAVFEKLILPLAVEHKLKQEDMVKQVFVFSDMQFYMAGSHSAGKWTTSYERIEKQFKEAGYQMPKLIFWNLAGGRAGYDDISLDGGDGDGAAPKPVTAADEGTALVSGYSQGQMKMFLENGSFEDPEGKEEVKDEEGEDGEIVVGMVKKKQDPLAVVRKAIGHEAYRMLKVVD